MIDKTYFPAEVKITLADGTYKNIEDIEIGDEVQTYDMNHEEFDAASMHLNEQTSTKVKFCHSKEMNLKNFIKIEFKQYIDPEHDLSPMDIEDIENKDIESLIINKYGTVMGGYNKGWVVYKRDELVSFLNTTETIDETGNVSLAGRGPSASSSHDFSDMYSKLEVGDCISTDSGKNLKEFEVTVITDFIDEDEEITAYCIDSLEKGNTIFANDVLVRAESND